MTKYILTLLTFLVTINLSAQRVVVLGLDGFGSEGFKAVKHPNIDKLFEKGFLTVTARPVMPSVTLPNWTSHFTGSGPEEHGVVSNAWTIKDHALQAIETDANGYYPSIFKLLKEQVPDSRTAFYYNWKELINSTNQKYLDEASFQFNDGFDSNYVKAINFISGNRGDPLLVFLYSVHTDHAGHSYGWMSPEYVKAIEKADSAIGGFIEALKMQQLFDKTYFLLITDHGGINKGHGGTSMQEMQIPWAITGPGIRSANPANIYVSNKFTSHVLAEIFKITKLPSGWAGFNRKGIFK